MSYFPSDIPYMTDEELEEHGINVKRERNEMSYISEKIDKIHANTIEIKSVMGNTIMMLDNIKSALKADVQSEINAAYQRGLDDAWEAARKVVLCAEEGGLSIEELDEIFGCSTIQQVFRRYSVQQTIEKLKAYEEQKANDEIKVGDIIANNTEPKLKVWVTYFDEIGFCGTAITDFGTVDEGQLYTSCSPKGWHKIGHFDMSKILEEMKKIN